MIRTLKRRWRSHFDSRPLVLDRKAAENARFCFAGEFGYELISWIPYLNYLATTRGLRLKTASRPGSDLFYKFSTDHQDLLADDIGAMWGDARSYASLSRRFRGEMIVNPGPDMINRRRICVDGAEWEIKNIHKKLEAVNYLLPDLSGVRVPLSLPVERKIAVVNNKYFLQWPLTFDAPINFFSREDLTQLRDTFRRHGYFVVYNHFVEKTPYDKFGKLNDEGIFGNDGNSIDLRKWYEKTSSPAARNELQVSLYNRAELVVGPQGGNLYLPAFSRRPLYILMRAGDSIDYIELGRLCGVPVEIFYQPEHLIHWLDTKVLSES